jgi:hypothetical protein
MIIKINNLNCETIFYNKISERINKEGTTINKIYAAKEYYNKTDDQYKYNYIVLKNIEELEQITKTNNNIHEILQHNKELKPFLDIDLILDDYDFNINKDEFLNNILDEYINIFFSCFNITINRNDVVIIDGTTNIKISFHIIINNNKYFYNINQQKEFIKYIHSNNIIIKNGINNIQMNKILDSSVYNKNKNFRLTNQAKLKNNEHVFKIVSKHNFRESLIINYFEQSKNNILNCEFIRQQKSNKHNNFINHHNINKCNSIINNVVYNDEIKQDLNILLSFISSDYFEKYDSWFKIGVAIKNINYDFYDLFDFYSNQHKNYKEEQNKYIYNASNGSYSWEYLFSLASNEKLSDWVKNKLIHDYNIFDGSEIPKNINVINDEGEFINEQLLINSTNKHILIKAIMGKGKSQAIYKYIEWLKINKNKNVNNNEIEEEQQININIEYYKKNIEYNNNMMIREETKQFKDNYLKDNEKFKNKIEDLIKFKNTNPIIKNKSKIKKEFNILVVSPRITFSEHMQKELFKVDDTIKNYLDVDDLFKYNNSLIISVESLYKLNFNNKYDVIILDEIESILNQFSSTTCKNKNNCYNILIQFINNSNKILYADAFINSRTYEFLNNFSENKTLIINNVFENKKQVNIYNCEDTLINKMLEELKEGNKIYAHFSSCTKGQQVLNKIIDEKILEAYYTIYYSSNETIKEGEEQTNNNKLNNINEEWGRLKYISSTSSITVGNSYTNKDVNSVYIFGGINACCVRDSFQNHMRIRHNMGDLNVFIPDEQKIYNTCLLNYMCKEKDLNNNLNEIQQHNYFKNNLEYDDINYLIKNEIIKDNNLKLFLLNNKYFDENKKTEYTLKQKETIIKKYELLLKYYETINNNFNSSLEKIHNLNKFEKYINNSIYAHIFIDYLNKMKYKINDLRKNQEEPDNTKLKLKIINVKYNEINNIKKEVAEDYIRREKKGEGLTYNKKLEKEKYFFNTFFNTNETNENDTRKEQIFNNIYMQRDTKEKLINVILEFNYYNNNKKYKEQINKYYEKLTLDQTERGIKYNKLFEIIELNKIFNIKGSYNEKIIIDVNDLQKKFKKYIKSEGKINKIKSLFNINYDLNKIDESAYNKKIMSNIYNDFNGCTLQNNEIKKTSKTDTAINFKMMNIFNKKQNKETKKNNNNEEHKIFKLDGLFKIYAEFNHEDINFID